MAEKVNLFTDRGLTEGLFKVLPEGIYWKDMTKNSLNKLEISKRAIFAVTLSTNNRKSYKSIKEAAELCSGVEKSNRFTIFTITRNEEGKNKRNSLRNKIQPLFDMWVFEAVNEIFAEKYVGEIRGIINNNKKVGSVDKGHFLIMMNELSGTGKGMSIFETHVEPIFKISRVKYTLISTKTRDFAKEYMESEDLSKYTTFISVGGDGTLNQMINGLMKREDYHLYKDVPFAIIPTGSGNGLAWSVDCGWPELAASSIVKGTSKALDLLAFTKDDGQTHFCFLSVTWGMVADIDIESEKLKKVGKARFDLYGMLRLLRLRQYGGRIHYLPAERKKQPENGAGDAAQETRREKAEFVIGDQDEREQEEVSPEMVETSKSPTSRWKAVGASQLKQHGGGVHRPSPLGQNAIKMNEDVQEGREQGVDDAARMPSLHATNKYIEFKPLSNISVPVNRTEDLGPKWKTIEGPFVSVNAVNLPWLSNSFMVSEFASLNDGAFDLVYAKGVGKWVLMSYLIDSTRGGFMNQNGIFHEKIQALIVEPSGTRGIGTANTTNTPSSRPATAKKGNRLSKLFSRNSVASINNVQDHKSNGDAQQDSSVEGSNGSKKGLFSFDGEPSTVGALKIQVIKQPLQIITSPWFIDTKYLTSQAQARSRNRSHHKKASAANNDYSISVNKLENSFGNEESSIYGNSPSVSGIWSGDGHARGGPGASDSIFNDEFHGSSYHSNHFGHYNDSRDALINSPISRSGSYISLQ